MEVKLTSSCQMNKCLMLANKLNYINNKFLKVVKKKKTGELKVTPYMQDCPSCKIYALSILYCPNEFFQKFISRKVSISCLDSRLE